MIKLSLDLLAHNGEFLTFLLIK